MKVRRKSAAWDSEYLEEIISRYLRAPAEVIS
jgi:hypothetical protein